MCSKVHVYIRFTAQTGEQTYVRNYINYIMVQTLHSCKRKKQADSHSDAGPELGYGVKEDMSFTSK